MKDCAVFFIKFCFLVGLLVSATGKSPKRRPRVTRSNEYKIKRMILRHYDKTTRPVRNDSTPVNVNVAISLYHILDTNEKEQTFTSLLAIRQRWRDEYLVWNASEYGGVGTIRIPANQIWTPDLVISNFAGDKFNDFMVTNTIVSANGAVLWLYPALIKTYCTLNVKYFPFDSQNCEIVFISWTFSGDQLDVLYNTSFKNSVYYKPENQEWAVDGISAKRNEKYYACCKEPYPDVTFTIHMRRGSLFYIVNLIAPCFLIFLIAFLGFFLPVESGEKVNLETTILLALVVFLLMVGETMPPTPDAIPVLGMFFGSTMVMVTIALVMAVITTNVYAKKDSGQRPPRWLAQLALRMFAHQAMLPPEPRQAPGSRDRKQDCNGRQVDVMSITDGELDSLTCGCCCHCKRDPRDHAHHRGMGGMGGGMGGGYGLRELDLDRIDVEWRMISKLCDRIFFWLFFVLSFCVQTALFMHMVPPT